MVNRLPTQVEESPISRSVFPSVSRICQLSNKHGTGLGAEYPTNANSDAGKDKHSYIDRCALNRSPGAGDDDSAEQNWLASETITEVA